MEELGLGSGLPEFWIHERTASPKCCLHYVKSIKIDLQKMGRKSRVFIKHTLIVITTISMELPLRTPAEWKGPHRSDFLTGRIE